MRVQCTMPAKKNIQKLSIFISQCPIYFVKGQPRAVERDSHNGFLCNPPLPLSNLPKMARVRSYFVSNVNFSNIYHCKKIFIYPKR